MTILLHMCAITSACKISQPYVRSDVSRSHRLQSLHYCAIKEGGGQWSQYLPKRLMWELHEGCDVCVKGYEVLFSDRLFTFSTKDLVSYSRCKQIPPLLKIVPYGRLH